MPRSYWNESSAFFRLTEQDLSQSLHGWLMPPPLLDEPVVRQGINPFTKQPIEIRSRIPPQPDEGLPDAIRNPNLDAYPWVSTEGLQPSDMCDLTQVLLSCSNDEAWSHWGRFLAGPEDANDILQPASPEFVLAVAMLPKSSLRDAAAAWQAATEVEDLAEGWPLRILGRMHGFFSQAPEAAYFLWTCR